MAHSKENLSDFPKYLFHQGKNFNAYDFLGAHFEDDAWVFRVWAPNAMRVYVTGDFCDWDEMLFEAERISEKGIYECRIESAKEFDAYKFVILTYDNEKRLKADPYAFHAETKPGTASKLYQLDGYKWNDQKWIADRKPLYNAPMNIYEIHLGSWKRYDDGNYYDYRRIAEELIPYLKKMNYTHVELMPIMEYPFDGSWGYQITAYYAPTSRFGKPKDFMYLIDQLHQNGIGVILDWVPAHFPKDEQGLYEFDGSCLYEYSDPLKREHQDWGTRIFDYGRNEVISFLISNAFFYLDKYHIDGLRIDAVSSMLYLDYGRKDGEWRPNKYGQNGNLEAMEFLKQLNTVIFQKFPNALMIAEESTSWPGITHPVEQNGLGFNYKWNMGWMNDSLQYMRTNPYFRSGLHNNLTFSLTYAFSENFILSLSHDEVVHGKRSILSKMPGSETERFSNMRAYLGYMFAHPGKKLNFMGNEFGQYIEWSEKQELDWLLLDYIPHQQMQDFNIDLNTFYKKEPSLWEQDFNWSGFLWGSVDDKKNNVIAFFRLDKNGDGLYCIFNFSGQHLSDYSLGTPARGLYTQVFSSDAKEYGGSGLNNGKVYTKLKRLHGHDYSISIDLPPFSAQFFKKRNIRTITKDEEKEVKPKSKKKRKQ